MSTPSLPNYKRPPRAMIEQARAERERRRACHGNVTACTAECPR